MQKVIRHTKTNLFYIEGRGFSVKDVNKATHYDSYDHADEALEDYGIKGKTQAKNQEQAVIESAPEVVDPNLKQNPDGSSFAVSFIRTKDVTGDTIKIHKFSPRRFATRKEAVHHGSRFMLIEGHLGFSVKKTAEKVNAYINKKNGRTNPEIGKKRVDREVPVN